ncbi:MAG: YfdX family protein [Rhodopseudomonas palustris]|uniref:YfdX family protein n=1 Tax=Rhodopseudomonas palustris TaxID=1076 RepID=A0A933RVU8_RHOPL|nr:YfdX family protein [Rhodopseudomonas palustris]
MLRVKTTLIAAALATTALCGAVYAADHSTTPDQVAAQDFSKLSKDGFAAFQDIREARLALFNGKPDAARKDVNKAMESLEKSKTDDSIFTKAEADLKLPAQVAAAKQSGQSAPSTTPIKWLPVNGTITVQEDYSAVPAKAAALKTANAQLKAGKQKDALETLKMNDVNVAVALEVAPLDATLKGVDQASKMLDTGKYYEANGELMQVENGIRYAVVDINDKVPANTAAANTPASATKPAPTTSGQASATPSTATPSPAAPSATPSTAKPSTH